MRFLSKLCFAAILTLCLTSSAKAAACSNTSFANGWTCIKAANTSNAGTGATATATAGSNWTAGHALIMYAFVCSNASCNSSTTGYSIVPAACVGDALNITASPGSPFTVTNHLMYVWVLPSTAGGCATCGATVTGATPNYTTIECSEWTGMATSSVFDKDASNSGSGTSASVATATTTNATDLWFGAINSASTVATAGGGFTEVDLNTPNAFEWEGASVTVTGAATCTWTLASQNWAGVCVAIKAASAGTAKHTQVGAFVVGP